MGMEAGVGVEVEETLSRVLELVCGMEGKKVLEQESKEEVMEVGVEERVDKEVKLTLAWILEEVCELREENCFEVEATEEQAEGVGGDEEVAGGGDEEEAEKVVEGSEEDTQVLVEEVNVSGRTVEETEMSGVAVEGTQLIEDMEGAAEVIGRLLDKVSQEAKKDTQVISDDVEVEETGSALEGTKLIEEVVQTQVVGGDEEDTQIIGVDVEETSTTATEDTENSNSVVVEGDLEEASEKNVEVVQEKISDQAEVTTTFKEKEESKEGNLEEQEELVIVPTEGPQEIEEMDEETEPPVDWSSQVASLQEERDKLQAKCELLEGVEKKNDQLLEENRKLSEELGVCKQKNLEMFGEVWKLKRGLETEKQEKAEVQQSFTKFRTSVGTLFTQFMELNECLQVHFAECCKNPNKELSEDAQLTLLNRLDHLTLYTEDKFQVWTTEQLIMQEELMNAKDKLKELLQKLEGVGKQRSEADNVRNVILSKSNPDNEVISLGSPSSSPPKENEAPPSPPAEPSPLVIKVESEEFPKTAYFCEKCNISYLNQAILHRHQKTAHAKPAFGALTPKRPKVPAAEEDAPHSKRQKLSSTFSNPPPSSSPAPASDSEDDLMIIEEESKPVVTQPKPVLKLLSQVARSFVTPTPPNPYAAPEVILTASELPSQDTGVVPLKVIEKKPQNISSTGKRHCRDITKRNRGFYCVCGIKFISRRRLDGHLNFHTANKKTSVNGASSNSGGLIPASKIKQEKFEKIKKAKARKNSKASGGKGHSHEVDPSNDLRCICGYEVSDVKNLRKHIHYFTTKKKFSCDLCPKRFVSNSILKGHLRSSHKIDRKGGGSKVKKAGNLKTASLMCDICDISMATIKALYSHMKKAHKVKNLDKRQLYEKYQVRPRYAQVKPAGKKKLPKTSSEEDPVESDNEEVSDPDSDASDTPEVTLFPEEAPATPKPQEHKVDHKKKHKGFFCTCKLKFSTGKKLRNHVRLRNSQPEGDDQDDKPGSNNLFKSDAEQVYIPGGFVCMTCGQDFSSNLARIQHRMQAHGHGLLTEKRSK